MHHNPLFIPSLFHVVKQVSCENHGYQGDDLCNYLEGFQYIIAQ